MTIEIPNKATNGDVIKALFNVVEVKPYKKFSYAMSFPIEDKNNLDVTIQHENIRTTYTISKKLWNARYKEITNEGRINE